MQKKTKKKEPSVRRKNHDSCHFFLSQMSLESPWQPAVCTGGGLDSSGWFGGARWMSSNPSCYMYGSFPGLSPSNQQLITWGELPYQKPSQLPPPVGGEKNKPNMLYSAMSLWDWILTVDCGHCFCMCVVAAWISVQDKSRNWNVQKIPQ